MTPAQKRERAEQAKLLLGSDIFASSLTDVRMNALNALATCDADDKTEILRQQAIVAVTGELFDLLKAAILATGESDGGTSIQTSSDEE